MPASPSSSSISAIRLKSCPTPSLCPAPSISRPRHWPQRHIEIPRDRDIVLFCTCPSEATAAKTAMTLHKLGIDRVRPLRGGFDEWRRLGFPLDTVSDPGFVRITEATV